MKKVIFIIVFSISFSGFSQSHPNAIDYKYDNAGNRWQRSPCMNCRMAHNPANDAKDTTIQSDIEIAMQHGATVFPNPTQDKVVLSLSNLKDDELASVYVTDENGKTLYTQNNLSAKNEINMSSYNSGTYFVRLVIGKDVLIYKVLKVQ